MLATAVSRSKSLHAEEDQSIFKRVKSLLRLNGVLKAAKSKMGNGRNVPGIIGRGRTGWGLGKRESLWERRMLLGGGARDARLELYSGCFGYAFEILGDEGWRDEWRLEIDWWRLAELRGEARCGGWEVGYIEVGWWVEYGDGRSMVFFTISWGFQARKENIQPGRQKTQ